MRMIGLALFVFISAGLLIGLTQFDMFQNTADRFMGRQAVHNFEVTPKKDEDATKLDVVRFRPDGVLLLNESVNNQTARYVLPRDIGINAGILHIDATTQTSEGLAGTLRIFVRNEHRGEILLRPGHHQFNAEVGLTSNDLASNQLAVRFQLDTPDSGGSCTEATSRSNVIEIENTSRLVLDVASNEVTPRDEVTSWGNEVVIGWPRTITEEEKDRRLALAMQLAVRGYDVRLSQRQNDQVISVDALEALIASEEPALLVDEEVPAWPEYIAETGINAGKRTFHQTASWRHWYRISALDHQSEPGALEYSMMLGPLPEDATWTVTVTHNGSIMQVRETPGETHLFEGAVSLAGAHFDENNLVEITATSDYEATGLCNDGPPIFAELRPETRLIGGGAEIDNELEDMLRIVSHREEISVALPNGLSLVEAAHSIALARQIAPANARLNTGDGFADLTAVRRGDFTRIALDYAPLAHVVWLDEDSRLTSTSVASLGHEEAVLPHGALAFIVSPADTALQNAQHSE